MKNEGEISKISWSLTNEVLFKSHLLSGVWIVLSIVKGVLSIKLTTQMIWILREMGYNTIQKMSVVAGLKVLILLRRSTDWVTVRWRKNKGLSTVLLYGI